MDPSVAPNQVDTESANRMQTLESELEDLKKKATGETNFGVAPSGSGGSSGQTRRALLRIAFFLIIAALAFTGLSFARNALRSSGLSFTKKSTPTPTTLATPLLTPETSFAPEVSSWLTYTSGDGIFSFRHPSLVKIQPYSEESGSGRR